MTLHLERILPTDARTAFDAWLDPAVLSRFMCPAEGMRVGEVEVDARVGGKFLIEMIAGDRGMPHHGEYLAIDRHTRLEFTWLSPHAGEGSRVTLTFEALGPKRTRVVLDHVGLAEDRVAQHTRGWTSILEALASAIA